MPRLCLPPRPLGLRTKIILRFATMALVLSALLGTITYLTVRQLLLEDRKSSAVDQVLRDGQMLTALGAAATANPTELLVSLRPPTRSTPLLHRGGEWYAASLQVSPEDLPAELISIVMEGQPARQTVWLRDRPVLVVGVPLREGNAAYFEVLSLVDIANTLATLARVLSLAGVTTTVAGALLAGWISGRVLRPLREVTAVAQKISAGELESRLDESLDRDLTRLTVSFNRMAESLQQRIAREARFSSDVAHELRTPLTTLLTSIAVLEGRNEELSEEGREALELLSHNVRRLERTAADLIEIAKLDAGVVAPDLELLPTAEVVGGVLHRLHRPDIPVDVDQRAASALVWADSKRLERVLANLIQNADTHGKGVTRLVVEGGDHSVRIAVEDEGPGVPPDESERIFERFARGSGTQPSGNRGSGLGLALASENTRLQGGRIWVEDRRHGGARFVVELRAERP